MTETQTLSPEPLADHSPDGHHRDDRSVDADQHACGGCGGMSRRAVLTGVGALGAAVTLAACGGSSHDGIATPGSTPGSGSTGDATDDGTPDDPAPAGAIAKAADVPVGGAISATLDGTPVLITQPTAGTFVGLSAICTHQGCTVAPDDDHLTCPCHGSTFDLDGAATRGPASEPLITFELSLDGEDLVVGQGS